MFAGIVATLINLAYDYFYRDIAGFYPSEIINVSSIIFGTMLLFTVAGLIYFFLSKMFKRGTLIYILVFGVLTIFCFYAGMHVNRSNNPAEITQFRGLLLGTVALSGLLATFFIPYLTKHDSIYS